MPDAKPASEEVRKILLRIVKLRLQLLGSGTKDESEEMVLLEEIEDLQAKLRELAPDPLLPAPRPVAERRRYTRYTARIPVRYLVVNVPGIEALTLEDLAQIPSPPEDSWTVARTTHSTNVSAGGVAFLVPEPIGRGSILWVEVRLNGFSRVRAVASIARALPDGTGTLIGAEFFGLQPSESDALHASLEKQYGQAH